MELMVLDKIPFAVDLPALAKGLRIKSDSSLFDELAVLAEEAEKIAQPKAVFHLADVEAKDDEDININGTWFTSRVLSINLEGVYRVFPFVTTCGLELDEWSKSKTDVLTQFWTESIKGMALGTAYLALDQAIKENYSTGNLSAMTPGSLPDWPITEQRALFGMIGDTAAKIGVTLKDSLLLVPIHSGSGIMFPSEVNFQSCQLCFRGKCPGRRSPFDKALYKEKFKLTPLE